MYDDMPQVTETVYEPCDDIQTVLDAYHALGTYSTAGESEERKLPNGATATVIGNTVRIGENLVSLELIDHAFGITAILEGAYQMAVSELLDLAIGIGEPTAIYADRLVEELAIGEYVTVEAEFRSNEWEGKFNELFGGLEARFGSEHELPAHEELKDGVAGMTEEVWDEIRAEEVDHGPIALPVIERSFLESILAEESLRDT